MPVPVQLLPDGRFDAYEQNANVKLARGQDRAFHFGARRMVASHGIQGDGSHLGTNGLRSERQARET